MERVRRFNPDVDPVAPLTERLATESIPEGHGIVGFGYGDKTHIMTRPHAGWTMDRAIQNAQFQEAPDMLGKPMSSPSDLERRANR